MNVKVLARKGRSLLVEWRDEQGQQRSYVPLDSVVDIEGQTVCELAEMGIPFGVPWETLAHRLPAIDGTALQQELRRLGIWTLDDLNRSTAATNEAIRQVGGKFSVGQLGKLAAEYLQGVTYE
jgi:hypothetical protein